MQLKLDVDLSGKTPDVTLALIYAFDDNGNRFSYAGSGDMVETILDGAKLLTQAEYTAVIALPHTLDFAQPPVP